MAHDTNQRGARNGQAARATSKLYSAGFLMVLFLLLISVGANKSMSQGHKQGDGKKKSEPCTVTITFRGLFYFSFPNGTAGNPYRRECRVGILSTRQDHMLYITYTNPAGSTTLTFPHPALQSLPHEIEINKNPPEQQGVKISGCDDGCGGEGWGEPIDRNDKSKNPDYFNWIIDFEGRKLHGENIHEKSNKLRPVLRIKTGTFRTGELSVPYKYYIIRDGIAKDFGYVAATIQDCITLNAGEQLTLKVGPDVFPLPPGISEIKLDNVRPEHEQHMLRSGRDRQGSKTEAQMDMEAPASDELHIYYDDLLDISNERERFHFVPVRTPLKRAVPFVCYGVGGSKE